MPDGSLRVVEFMPTEMRLSMDGGAAAPLFDGGMFSLSAFV
jgi:hypothetical protein